LKGTKGDTYGLEKDMITALDMVLADLEPIASKPNANA
jgi:hypothetical protein